MARHCWPSGARGRANWQVTANGGGHASAAVNGMHVASQANWRTWMQPVRSQPLPETPAANTIAPLPDDDGCNG